MFNVFLWQKNDVMTQYFTDNLITKPTEKGTPVLRNSTDTLPSSPSLPLYGAQAISKGCFFYPRTSLKVKIISTDPPQFQATSTQKSKTTCLRSSTSPRGSSMTLMPIISFSRSGHGSLSKVWTEKCSEPLRSRLFSCLDDITIL